MTVPLVDLRAQYLSLKREIDEAIGRVLLRASFIHGEEVAFFEREFAAYCGAKEAVGVASGTDALLMALQACDVGPGDEVITTPLAFVSTVEAICRVGARPVFVDIDPGTCNLDASRIQAAVTARARAVVAVHMYGNPADMDATCDVARRNGLAVIEDAAQAHGAKYRGRYVGTLGQVGCFGFYPSANLGAFGDAGMAVTDDATIAGRIRLLRDHGRQVRGAEYLVVGLDSRMDTLQAAVLEVKLARLDEWNARRRELALMYRRLLGGLALELLPESPWAEPSYHSFVIRTAQRGHLRRALTSAGIDTGINFPIPLHLQPAYRHLGYQTGDFPASERAAQEVLCLPMYPELTDSQVLEVVSAISSVLGPAPQGTLRMSAGVAAGDSA